MSTQALSNQTQKFPPQIKYIVGNEAVERYSFYGMRSILMVFMLQHLLMTEDAAVGVYHNFAAFVYLTPLLGAYISDRFWGKYKTIMWLSVVYCLGHLVLALYENKTGLYWGLALITLGSGGIKPCVSAHVGDQFKAHQKTMLEKVFSLFYWMINFGSFFSTIITPWTLKKYGPSIAFGIPGILMALATVIFWMGKKHYVHVPPTGPNPHGFFRILWHGILGLVSGEGFRATALKKHPEQEVSGAISVLKLMVVYIWISVFWALFDQSGSTWIIQGEKMNKLSILGYGIDPSQIQALNPILVMIIIPIFSKFLYPWAERAGFELTPLRKIVIGMFVAALSFVAVALIQHGIEAGQNLSLGYQLIPYVIITIAEVLISITGLEFAYTQAPRSMKSAVMSMWLLTVFFGNILTSYLTKLAIYETASSGYFWQFSILMGIVAFIIWFFSKFYKTQTYMEA